MEEIGPICMFIFITNSHICPEITESTYLLAHLTDKSDCTYRPRDVLTDKSGQTQSYCHQCKMAECKISQLWIRSWNYWRNSDVLSWKLDYLIARSCTLQYEWKFLGHLHHSLHRSDSTRKIEQLPVYKVKLWIKSGLWISCKLNSIWPQLDTN